MKKNCTDTKQSKKLIELGIEVNTADMFYCNGHVSVLQSNDFITVNSRMREIYPEAENYIPAWSLSALMEFMNRNGYSISLNCNGALWTVKFDDSKTYHYITCYYSIDAAFEMVVWLKENNKI